MNKFLNNDDCVVRKFCWITVLITLLAVFFVPVSSRIPKSLRNGITSGNHDSALITNSSCVNNIPFPIPGSKSSYFHCFPLNDGSWLLTEGHCPTHGIFHLPSGTCILMEPNATHSIPPVSEAIVGVNHTTTDDDVTHSCTKEGIFSHPSDSAKYFRCIEILGQFLQHVFVCPTYSCYDQSKQLCVSGPCIAILPDADELTNATTTVAPLPCQGVTTDNTTSNEITAPVIVVNSTTIHTPTTEDVTSTTETIEITAPEASTPPTTVPSGLPTCHAPGIFADNSDCGRYHRCVQVSGTWYVYIWTCPSNSYFDNSIPACVIGYCPKNNVSDHITTTSTLPPSTSTFLTIETTSDVSEISHNLTSTHATTMSLEFSSTTTFEKLTTESHSDTEALTNSTSTNHPIMETAGTESSHDVPLTTLAPETQLLSMGKMKHPIKMGQNNLNHLKLRKKRPIQP